MKENRVVLFDYDSFSRKAIEYDTAPHYITPLFKIGDVARMMNRSVETIRKYESQDLIKKAKQFPISESTDLKIRLYTEADIYELAEFFANRRPVGRPTNTNKVSKINQKELMAYINARFQRIK